MKEDIEVIDFDYFDHAAANRTTPDRHFVFAVGEEDFDGVGMTVSAEVFGDKFVFEADFVGEFEAFSDVWITGLEFHHAGEKRAVGGVAFVNFTERAVKVKGYFCRSVMV